MDCVKGCVKCAVAMKHVEVADARDGVKKWREDVVFKILHRRTPGDYSARPPKSLFAHKISSPCGVYS
jgi:hypothetical protein